MDSQEEYTNPVPPPLEGDDNLLLRGDAIGDTAYTHRWVLSCLLTIVKNLPKYVNGLESGDPSLDGKSSTKSLSDNQSWRQAVENGEKDISNSSLSEDNCSANDISIKEPNDSSENIETSEGNDKKEACDIVELDPEVEDAACQLWDMTVEKDVALHLLHLDELSILQLAAQILTNSKAPRLTEVMTGIVANLCCQTEGCQQVFEDKHGVLEAALELMVNISDVPTLLEVVRLLKLLLWHRINKTPEEEHSSCPLLLAFKSSQMVEIVAFTLRNCLNENLVVSIFELLESLLFVKLPDLSTSMADYYGTEELIEWLIKIFIKNMNKFDNIGDEKIHLHKSVVCLYSFIDTDASIKIQSYQEKNNALLYSLFQYIEKHAQIQSSNELIGNPSDRIVWTLGIMQLLIPYLDTGKIIHHIARLLAMARCQTIHYVASRSNSTEEDAQYTDKDPGWLSPPNIVVNQSRISNTPKSPVIDEGEIHEELIDLEETLCDFCGNIFKWWWSQHPNVNTERVKINLLSKLDECHANEVVLVFKAIRSREPDIVSLLQEYLLDKGTHPRLVSLLAHMYQ